MQNQQLKMSPVSPPQGEAKPEAEPVRRLDLTVPSPPRRGRIIRRHPEKPATGLARHASTQPESCDGCSFPQGEKVRMRASHEELRPAPDALRAAFLVPDG